MATHEGLHESIDRLQPTTVDLHRAIVSMIEELEAVDWYQQRADATTDSSLTRILVHHRNEEIEHFCMALEYVRRKSPEFDVSLRTYLFREGDIVTHEQSISNSSISDVSKSASPNSEPLGSRLLDYTIGSLKNPVS